MCIQFPANVLYSLHQIGYWRTHIIKLSLYDGIKINFIQSLLRRNCSVIKYDPFSCGKSGGFPFSTLVTLVLSAFAQRLLVILCFWYAMYLSYCHIFV